MQQNLSHTNSAFRPPSAQKPGLNDKEKQVRVQINLNFVAQSKKESVFKVKNDLAITPSLLEKLKISPQTPAFPSPNMPNTTDLSLLNQSFNKFPYPGAQRRELVKSSCSTHLKKDRLDDFKAKMLVLKLLRAEPLEKRVHKDSSASSSAAENPEEKERLACSEEEKKPEKE